ncbi:MAG: sodium:solute symporter family transporter [Acidobacteriaceae bacterium]
MHTLDLLLVVLYLIGITIFGLRFRQKERSLRSYFLADRSIPWWAIALSIVAAETSTLTIISVPGLAYAGDFGFLQIVFGYLLGRILVCILFLPKYFQGELFTAYQLIDRRFGHRLHKVTALLFLLTRAAAEGVRVFAVSIVVGIAIGTNDILSIAIISVLTLIYTLEGGMAAVIWTDVVQMIIYIAGTLIGLWTLGQHIPGGWTTIHHIAGAAGKFHMLHFAVNLTTTYTFWAGLIGGTFLTMASHGTDQLMVQRLLAAKNLRESRLALLSSGVVILLQFSLFLLAGAGLYVFYMQHPPAVAFASADRIFPSFIVEQMPIGISGLLVAAILAAAMSNLSAALNSLSSTSVIDFYLRWRPTADERERTIISRASTLLWALVLFALAVFSRRGGHVVEVGLAIASVAYGALLGVFLLGTLTRNANENGAILGMITGFALNVFLWRQTAALHWTMAGHSFTIPHVAWTWYVPIGTLVTFCVGYICSLLLRGAQKPKAAATVAAVLLIAIFVAPRTANAQPKAHATATNTSEPDFHVIDQLMDDALAAHKLPGAVVLIGHNGKVVFEKAYGHRSLVPDIEPMTEDTIFDMASLTKCLATSTALMQLYQKGLFSFDDPVSKYLPAFAVNGKKDVTIRDLMTHYSGLPPDVDLKDEWSGKEEGMRRAFDSELMTKPGTTFRYSDINFITLGALVEKLSGQTLDQYTLEHIYIPLGMKHTRFLPPIIWLPKIAPTEFDEHEKIMRGIVDDPTARRMGGVAGHAGLYSTAADVSIYAQALLDRLAGRPSDFPLSQQSLELMTKPEQPATALQAGVDHKVYLRGVGWDIDSPFAGNRGILFPIGSFGHTGYTGTSLWIDPDSDTYLIILANSVHPREVHNITPLRRAIATATARALHLYTPKQITLNGIDVLESTSFAALRAAAKQHGGHLRLGLLTNQTGLDHNDRRTIDILAKDAAAAVPGLKLETIFSPEHGIAGVKDSTDINNSTDIATGLPIVSLYGATDAQRRPKLEELRKLDAVLIDLQDAGVRYYTYEAAMGYFLEAAAKTGTEIIVLDRPNIITGTAVQGPVSDKGAESYTDYMQLPVRHGMTLGELAKYFNGEKRLHANLSVVPVQGWYRNQWFDQTDLRWVDPSPNLRSLNEATLYPGVGLTEATNISVGRGTEFPFEHIGAPWINGEKLATYLNARKIPGIHFDATSFTPEKPYPYAEKVCNGVEFTVTDRNHLNSPEFGIELLSALHKLYPKEFHLDAAHRLLANRTTLNAIKKGTDPRKIAQTWNRQLSTFNKRRAKYLIYKASMQK